MSLSLILKGRESLGKEFLFPIYFRLNSGVAKKLKRARRKVGLYIDFANILIDIEEQFQFNTWT